MTNSNEFLPPAPHISAGEAVRVSEAAYTEFLSGERPFESTMEAIVRGAGTDAGRETEGWTTLAAEATLTRKWVKVHQGNHVIVGGEYTLHNDDARERLLKRMAEAQGLSALAAEDIPALDNRSLVVELGNSKRAKRVKDKLRMNGVVGLSALAGLEVQVSPPETPEEAALREKVHAAIVVAVRAGELTLGQVVQLGRVVPAGLLARHSGLGEEEIARALLTYDPRDITAAIKRAQELPSLSPRRPHRRQRRVHHLPPMPSVPREPIEVPTYADYTTWADVCQYYLRETSYSPSDAADSDPAHWGMFYVDDLIEWPDPMGQALDSNERRVLQESFIQLNGIPKIAGAELEELTNQLPPNIPYLYFTGGRNILSFRSGTGPIPRLSEAVELRREQTLLLNLLMLKVLRASGRSVGEVWLRQTTGYGQNKFDQHMFGLVEQVTGDSGVIIQTSGRQNLHRNIASNACVVDAREGLTE